MSAPSPSPFTVVAPSRSAVTHRVCCDRCTATAQVLVLLPSGLDLQFCSHHGSKYSDALTELGAQVLHISD